MTENVDVTQETDGLDATPAAPASPSTQTAPTPSQQDSPKEYLSKAEFEAFKSEMTGRVGGLQGAWDKQTDALAKRMEALGLELSPEQKRDSMFLDMQETLNSLTKPAENGLPASEPTQPQVDYADIIKSLELDANSPSVLNAVLAHQDNITELKAALVDLKHPVQPATAASVTQPSASVPQAIASADSLMEQIQANLADPDYMITGSPARAKVAELRQQLQKLEG
jgi:hypothetical protein